jgi:hypothetical protein
MRELGVVPDAQAVDSELTADGKAWCLGCSEEAPYRITSVEFLGNPVHSTCLCLRCGSRVHPEATDGPAARRRRAEARRTRFGAGLFFVLIILFPIFLLGAALWVIWRLL